MFDQFWHVKTLINYFKVPFSQLTYQTEGEKDIKIGYKQLIIKSIQNYYNQKEVDI